jgi:hypothetical protein
MNNECGDTDNNWLHRSDGFNELEQIDAKSRLTCFPIIFSCGFLLGHMNAKYYVFQSIVSRYTSDTPLSSRGKVPMYIFKLHDLSS